jgi:hypothetical protein
MDVGEKVPDTFSFCPDVRSPAFEAEAHRQSLAVAQSPHEGEDQAFIDAIADRDSGLKT